MIYEHDWLEMREWTENLYKKAEKIEDKRARYKLLHYIGLVQDEIETALQDINDE